MACANEFLFCGYAVKILVPITAFLQLAPKNPNVKVYKASDFLLWGYAFEFLLIHTGRQVEVEVEVEA